MERSNWDDEGMDLWII